ncbi:MAG: TIGR03668 family PPOX class F420-dependent oxidoreductase [Blastocatellia bacterium]
MTDWERTFISEQRVARLATVDAIGQPAVIPIVYAFDGAALFTPLDAKPKRVAAAQIQRVRNIQANPRVAVIIDSYSEDWRRLAWVHVRGQARIITGGNEYAAGITLLCAKYPQYERMPLAGCLLIVIEPTRIRSWRASDATDILD